MMINERFEHVYTADGETVQVRFDLADEQLRAIANAAAAVANERYMGAELTAEDVLELRELMAVADNAAERAADGYSGGTLVMTVARLGLTVRALRERLARLDELGFMRAQDALDRPLIEAMLDDLTDLHLRALQAALGVETPTYTP